MSDDESPLGGPLNLPGNDDVVSHTSSSTRKSRKRHLKKLVILLSALLGLAIIGFGSWKFFSRKPSVPVPQATSNQETAAKPTTTTDKTDVPETTGTKTFKSDTLVVQLTHPQSWTATEATGGIRIESPEFNFTTLDRGTVTGNFRIYLRKGSRTVDSKYIGRGVAAVPSEKLTYTKPTTTQRKDTNLSFFGLDTADHFAYFLVAGNFSLKQGDTLGPDYGKEAETFIVTGGYSAKSLTDDLASYKMPLDSFQKTNAYKQAVEIIKSLQL